MSLELLGIVSVIILISLMILGTPIAFAAALTGIFGLVNVLGLKLGLMAAGFVPYGLGSYSLAIVPLFVLMGYMATAAGFASDLYLSAYRWLSRLPGGLAIASIVGSGGFAALCGSSTASAAAMSRIAIPEMRRYGYKDSLNVGAVAAGGTLASLIPPSIPLVMFGIIAEQPIGPLLLAGYLPGLLSIANFGVSITIRCLLNRQLAPAAPSFSLRERASATVGAIPMFAIIVVIFLGIYTGLTTPTECGALAAGLMFVGGLIKGRFSFIKKMKKVLSDTIKTTVMVFTLVWGVLIFVQFVAYTGIITKASSAIANLPLSPTGIILLLMVVYFFLGMFMEMLGMMFLTLPVVLPALHLLNVDLIFFGILLIKIFEIGLLTPPIGLNVFVVASGAPDIPMGTVFRGAIPFVITDLVTLGLLMFFPQIVLFFPRLVMG